MPDKPLEWPPFTNWLPFLAGIAAGVVLRVVFWGKPGQPYAPMMASFIFLCPAVVGAVTVYVAERRQRRTWSYYFWAPFFANLAFVIGTLVIMIEGLICGVIIAPLLAVVGGVAGLIMGAVCRVTKWPKQVLLSFGVLPLVLGGFEGHLPEPVHVGTVERSVLVDATPQIVWRQILNAENIQPTELQQAWIFRIGVPLPLAGVTRRGAEGTVRRVTMGKNVYFDEIITEEHEARFVRWLYRFHEDSFPPYALDEHVVIGGHYFDLVDTAYTLTPRGSRTELKVRMRYRVSTQFNWYADAVARILLGNMEEANLNFYRVRSEKEKAARGRPFAWNLGIGL
jgi:hypothetical protein